MEISAQDVSAGYAGVAVLRGVSLVARPGEVLGLIGPNGSGKTTLLRTLANLQSPYAGSIRYAGRTAAEIGAEEFSRCIAYLAQGGDVHWPMRTEVVVALGRLPHRKSFRPLRLSDRQAIERAMEMTDTQTLYGRTMQHLSGGERRRVLLARALAVEAEMLLADEPTAALDPLHQLQTMTLLQAAARQGRGVVVVLHDLALAARFCDRLVLLAEKTILAQGAPADVLTDSRVAQAYGVSVVRGERDGMMYLLPWSAGPEGS